MAKAAPFWDPSAIFDIPEPGTMPRSQFDQVVQKKMKEMKMAMPPTPQPVESPGMRLGQAMRQAFTPSQAPIDAGIKAGLMPEQVTAVNQQLLAERQLEQQNAIAQEEMGIKREYADVQRQQAAMGLEEQRMKLAAMFMPKPYEPKLEVVGNTVMDLNDPRNVGSIVPEEGMDAYQREQIRLREQELGMRGADMQARLGLQRQSLALRARGGGAGGAGKPRFGTDPIYGPYEVRDGQVIYASGYKPRPKEAPEAPSVGDTDIAINLANETRLRPILENVIKLRDEAALGNLAAQYDGPKNIPPERLIALAAKLAPEETAREEAIREASVTRIREGGVPFGVTDEVVKDGSGNYMLKSDMEIGPDQPPVPNPLSFPLPGAPAPAQAPPPKPKQMTMSEMLGLRRPVSVNAPVNPYQRMFE